MDPDAVRLPLSTDLKTSISDVTKDARLINAHAETRGGIQRVKKRPGALATGWDFTTPIQGLFGGGLLYLIYGDEFAIVDVDNPPPGEVLIGDLVGGYYAMIDNPPTSPGPGDAYWSASPPGADRWRVNFSAGASGYDPCDIYPRFVGGKGASTGAAAKLFMQQIAAIPSGVAVLADSLGDYNPDAVIETYAFPTPSTFTYSESFGLGWVYSDANQKAVLAAYPSGWPSLADFSSPSFVASSRVGSMGKRKTKTTFTISATGDIGRLPLSTFSGSGESLYGTVTWLEVSGCDQPEFNGEFLAYQIPNPAGFPISDGFLYFQLSAAPASSPATGASKQLAYYTKI